MTVHIYYSLVSFYVYIFKSKYISCSNELCTFRYYRGTMASQGPAVGVDDDWSTLAQWSGARHALPNLSRYAPLLSYFQS